MRASAFVRRPNLRRVSRGNEHQAIARFILVDVGEVVVQILAPETCPLVVVVEDLDSRFRETGGDSFGLGALFAGK